LLIFVRLSHGNNAYRFIRFCRGYRHYLTIQQPQRNVARFAIIKAPVFKGYSLGAFDDAPRIVKIQRVLFQVCGFLLQVITVSHGRFNIHT
jgi:hypothetical protein